MGMHIRQAGDATYTEDFAKCVAELSYAQLSAATLHSAKRGLLDWLGCVLVGSMHPTPSILLETLKENGSSEQSLVLGLGGKLSYTDACLVNGQMGHILDFDDTHMGGVVLHASSPILSALMSESQRKTTSPQDFLLAYVCGFEAGVRVGQSSPDHHAGGWHLTGTLGTLAAGVAVGKLIGLDAQQMTYAMGIAATQASGMQQNRGTMCKSFHAGRAASNGLLAARLALRGFNSSPEIVEGKRGFSKIYSQRSEPVKMVENLGKAWEIDHNGFKPYACGVVLHPAIDAMIELHRLSLCGLSDIEAIDVSVHPLVVSITGTQAPTSGLHSKFSIYHSVAIALVDGQAGLDQYSDARVLDPLVEQLRQKIKVYVDEGLARDQAKARLTYQGQHKEVFVEHARGTIAHPMSDQDLELKFMANASKVLGEKKSKAIAQKIWALETLADMSELWQMCSAT
jgi:2-methylcitrate dehydratase PrpD